MSRSVVDVNADDTAFGVLVEGLGHFAQPQVVGFSFDSATAESIGKETLVFEPRAARRHDVARQVVLQVWGRPQRAGADDVPFRSFHVAVPTAADFVPIPATIGIEGRGVEESAAVDASRPADPVCQSLGERVQVVLVQFVVLCHPDNLVLFQVFPVGRDFQLLVERRQCVDDKRLRIALRTDDDERAVVHLENGKC